MFVVYAYVCVCVCVLYECPYVCGICTRVCIYECLYVCGIGIHVFVSAHGCICRDQKK